MTAKPAHRPRNNTSARNSVRIIGGAWRRSVVTFADSDGLRPTPDRVRETLFNWLGQDLVGRTVLDAFAGTGALALEAASRGAARVFALDTSPSAVRMIAEHGERLGGETVGGQLTVMRADALGWLNTCGAVFDVIFLDPPFAADLYEKLALSAPQVLSPGGLLYLEAPREFASFGLLARSKYGKAGAVHYHLFSHRDSIQNNAS